MSPGQVLLQKDPNFQRLDFDARRRELYSPHREALDPAVRQAIESAPTEGLKAMAEKAPTLARVVNGWQINTDTMDVYGDWNGDGTSTIGAVDPTSMAWYLRNENRSGTPGAGVFQYGAPGWIPVVDRKSVV